MDDVGRFADGQFSSTRLMEHALADAHVIEKDEKLEWHANHETMDQARARMHDEPVKTIRDAAVDALGGRYAKHGFAGFQEMAGDGLKAMAGLGAGSFVAKLGILPELSVVGAPEIAGAALVAAPIALIAHACDQDEELQMKAKVDVLDVAVMSLVEIDPEFRMAEMKKYPSINAQKATRFLRDPDGRPSQAGKTVLPELQAAADAGSKAAFEALRCGGREAFLSRDGALVKRLANDIAFNKGFESVMWSAAQPDGAARLNAIQGGIDARNVQRAEPHRIQG